MGPQEKKKNPFLIQTKCVLTMCVYMQQRKAQFQSDRLAPVQTCYCFDHVLRDFWDFFVHGHTQHLDGHPVQGPGTHTHTHTQTDVVQTVPSNRQQRRLVKHGGAPDPVLCDQVLLLIVRGLWTEDALIQTSHDVLLHLIHHLLHGF